METATINTGELLAELREIIDRREALEREDKLLRERREEIERSLDDIARASGLDKFSGSGMSVTFDRAASRARYEPEQWSGIVKWAVENGHDYIVQRRLSDAKIQALADSGTPLPPGLTIEFYTKINARRI